MHSISCPSCDTVSSMKFVREEARYGFCYSLSLQCTDCDAVASKTFSSQRAATPQPSKPFIVNELIVLFFNQIGLGHSAMKKFASLFGWQGLHHSDCNIIIFELFVRHLSCKIKHVNYVRSINN